MIYYFTNICSRQRKNNKPIRVGYNIWVLAEEYCNILQFISRCKERKIGCLLCKIAINRKRCSAADEMLTINCLLVTIYLLINISHLFVCLPTLELTLFEQQVCSTTIGYANALSLRTNSSKK